MTVLIILAVWAALAVLALGLGSASAYADQQITRMNHLRGSGEEPVLYTEGTPMSGSEDIEHPVVLPAQPREHARVLRGTVRRVQSHDEAAAARMTEAKEADRG